MTPGREESVNLSAASDAARRGLNGGLAVRDPDEPAVIGARIRSARRAAGLSQEQLAQEIHVGRRTVYEWETGERAPRGERLEQLSLALGVSNAFLLTGRENYFPELYALWETARAANAELEAQSIALKQQTDELRRLRDEVTELAAATLDAVRLVNSLVEGTVSERQALQQEAEDDGAPG